VSTKPEAKHRHVTRADFDGLVCAALLKELDLIDEIVFVHPRDVAERLVTVTNRDILTNLPYDDRCFLAFDHHASEALRHGSDVPKNLVLDPEADSAARLVWRYYGGRKAFPGISERMLVAVDKADAARFTKEEVLDPSGWVLLNFIMDPRTGLGRFRDFRITNFELMMQLIDHCRTYSVDEILALPDVLERVELYFDHTEKAVEQIRRCTKMHENVAVLDLRDESTIYACNRFMIYALFPKCNVSVHVIWGRGGQNTVLAIGNSIFEQTNAINIGELCLRYGGGGHDDAGTTQVPHTDSERVLSEVIDRLQFGVDEPVVLTDDELPTKAEAILEQTLSESGMTLLPSKQDIRNISERLESIEDLLGAMTGSRGKN